MKFVGAGLGHHIDVGTCIAAVRGIILTGLDLEFLNGIRIRHGHSTAEIAALLEVVDLHSVHLEVIVVVGATGCDERVKAGSRYR